MLYSLVRWLPLVNFIIAFVHHGSVVQADADFESVRVSLKKDRSGKAGDPVEKYFHESTFADRVLGYDEKKSHLTALMQTYLSTMADIGVETWIMHGTLLGWWWNQKIMPWDSDVDVQMSYADMHFLASYYNMTMYHYQIPHLRGGRNYMMEINPGYINGDVEDHLNMIDARWIHTETGLFIDITTLRVNRTARALGVEGAMMCKDKHHYLENDIYPLRESVFESTPAKVPYNYAWLLEEEYHREAMTRTKYEGHEFNSTTMEWEKLKDQRNILKPKLPMGRTGRTGRRKGSSAAYSPP